MTDLGLWHTTQVLAVKVTGTRISYQQLC